MNDIKLAYNEYSIEKLTKDNLPFAQKFMKEEVSKNVFASISEKSFGEFISNLKEFWEQEWANDNLPFLDGIEIKISFFSEGLTGASVFRCEAHRINHKGESNVVISKYDSKDKIDIEYTNYRSVIGKSERKFPSLHKKYYFENGMSLFCMSSANESNRAETVFSAIKYVFNKYNQNLLSYYARHDIAKVISKVYRELFDTFYNNENGRLEELPSIQKYFAEKLDVERINRKVNHPLYGNFYDRFKEASSASEIPVEIYESFFSAIPDFPALASGYAIHKDLNPNNILIALVKEENSDEVSEPVLIDFYELQRKDHPKENWVPLLFDFTRFECQMFLYYFYYYWEQSNQKEFSSLLDIFTLVVEKLNDGKFGKLKSPNEDLISTSALDYLFLIFYELRKYTWKLLKTEGISSKSIYQNYLYSLAGFYFSFLKMDQETGVQIKWKLALAGANSTRKKLLELNESFSFDDLYQKSKSEDLGLEKEQYSYLERLRNRYVVVQESIAEVQSFLASSKSYLYISSKPGMGKSSLLAYLCEVLNGNTMDESLPNHFYCIPLFFGEDSVAVKQDPATYFYERLSSCFGKTLLTEDEKKKSREKLARLCELLYPTLERRKLEIVFIIDGLDISVGELENYILSSLGKRFRYILSSRDDDKWNVLVEKYQAKHRVHEYTLQKFDREHTYQFFKNWDLELEPKALDVMMEMTDGYPLYLQFISQLLLKGENGEPAKLNIHNLEKGLADIDKKELNSLYSFYDKIIQTKPVKGLLYYVLFSLTLAKDYLSVQQLVAINKAALNRSYPDIDIPTVLSKKLKNEILIHLREILEVDEKGRFKLYHQTFIDYIAKEYKEEIDNFKDTFYEYLKNYQTYEADTEDYLYCKQFIGIHLYEWAEKEKNGKYKTALEQLFVDVMNREEEEHKKWVGMLDAVAMFVIYKTKYEEEKIFKETIEKVSHKVSIPQKKDYLFCWIIGIGDNVKFLGYHGSWSYCFYSISYPIAEELARLEPYNTLYKRDISLSLVRIADVLVEFGKREEALEKYKESLAIEEQLSKLEPYNILYKRGISLSLVRIAEVLVTFGKREEALENYKESLAIQEQLSKLEPKNIEYKSDILFSLGRIADVLVTLGNREEALNKYKEILASWEQLSKLEPQNIQIKGNISASLDSIAYVLIEIGKREEALERFKESLAIREQLSKLEPHNIQIKGNISASLNSIADVLVEFGKREEALEKYKKSLAIWKQLSKLEPHNTRFKSNISVSLNNIAGVLIKLGKREETLEKYKESLTIQEQLSKLEPQNTRFKRGISDSHIRIADVLMEFGKREEALEKFKESLAIQEQLSKLEPKNIEYKTNILFSLGRIADVLVTLGNREEALNKYKEILASWEQLSKLEPQNTQYRRYISVSLERISAMLVEFGKKEEALNKFIESLASWEQLSKLEPQNTQYKRGISISLDGIADLLVEFGKGGEAFKKFKESLAIRESLSKLEPQNTQYKRDISVSYWKIGFLQLDREEKEAGGITLQKSFSILESLIHAKDIHYMSLVQFSFLSIKLHELYKEKDFLQRALTILQPIKEVIQFREQLEGLYQDIVNKLGLE